MYSLLSLFIVRPWPEEEEEEEKVMCVLLSLLFFLALARVLISVPSGAAVEERRDFQLSDTMMMMLLLLLSLSLSFSIFYESPSCVQLEHTFFSLLLLLQF